MAFSTEIEAKSPEVVAPGEKELPALESAPAWREAPGLPGWLSRPDVSLKLILTTLLAGAAVLFLTPAAFPPRGWRPTPPLPPRAAARRPPRRPPTPLPVWMRVQPSPAHPRRAARVRMASLRPHQPVRHPPASASIRPPSEHPTPNTQHPTSSTPPAPAIRLREPDGAICVVSRDGVMVGQERMPGEWARQVRRLFAPPPPLEDTPELPSLRLLKPDPSDAALLSPPTALRWSPVPDAHHYLLTLEVLINPEAQSWTPVQDMILLEVNDTEYLPPAELEWRPGEVYRWRVETDDSRFVATGRFRLLSDRQREQFELARDSFGSSRLLRAAIYRAYGFYGAALAELQALLAVQPDDPALRRALRNVEADIQRQRSAGSG